MLIICDFSIALRLLFRARFAWLASSFAIIVVLAMLLSAYFGARQPVTVAMDIGFSAIRLLLPLLIVLSVQELLSREFDKRYYPCSLSYPRARSSLLFGRFLALLTTVLGLLFVMAILQVALVKLVAVFYPQVSSVSIGQPYLVVLAFIALDLLVLSAFATLLAVLAPTPSFVLIGTFGFMLVARSYGAIVELLSRDAGLVAYVEGYRAGLSALSFLMPDLGALDVRMIAIYGKMEFLPVDWLLLFLANLSYATALIVLAILALRHKRLA